MNDKEIITKVLNEDLLKSFENGLRLAREDEQEKIRNEKTN